MDQALRHVVLQNRPRYIFLGTSSSTANASSYTFSAQDLGAPHQTRLSVAAVSGDEAGSANFNSVTIDSVTGTVVVVEATVGLGSASTPSGRESGDWVIGFSASINRCGIGRYAVYNLNSHTARDTGQATGGTDPQTFSIDIEAGGVLIASSYGAASTDTAWKNIFEDYDVLVEARRMSSASMLCPVTIRNMTVTADHTGTDADNNCAGASWR